MADPAPQNTPAEATTATPAPAKGGNPKQNKQKANDAKRGRNKDKGGAIELTPVMGTRDFPPEEMRQRNWLFGSFREVARLFAFQEYDAPVLELDELYKRKAGEEITQQMFNFKTKDDYEVTLRPEMTPSLARMILKNVKAIILPLRWFSIPQCWRFETIQIGRKREHYQWNMDIIGVESITAEAELLAAVVTFFKRVGLTSADIGIKVNSRKVLQAVLEPLGITPETFAPVCVIVDKLDKLSEEEVTNQLKALNIQGGVIEAIKSTLTIKDLAKLETILPADSPVVKDLKQLWTIAGAYGFADWITFDASVVRGLAYYTGIVFEGFDRAGKFRAICGGGRYDKLFTLYGAKQPIPACGFGFGDCVIAELLEEKKKIAESVRKPKTDYIVVAFDESLRPAANTCAAKLRNLGKSVDVQLIPGKKLVWCYSYADRIGADKLLLVAPDEWAKNQVRIKQLRVAETDANKEYNVDVATLDTQAP